MAPFVVCFARVRAILYRFRPRGPFAFGSAAGRGVSATIGSDALFSAVCLGLRDMFGPMRLSSFLRVVRASGSAPPVRLSSAVPYAGPVLFLPTPMVEEAPNTDWVSIGLFEQLVERRKPAGVTSLQEGRIAVTEDERKSVAALPTGKVWTELLRNRTALGAGGLETFVSQGVHFGPDCGLAVLAIVESEWRQDLDTAFRWLGDAGVGGERSSGYGQFDLAIEEINLPEAMNPAAYCTLSYYVPTARELEAGVLNRPAHYDIEERGGWMSHNNGTNLRHKSVPMIVPGSVLAPLTMQPQPEAPAGRASDVTPEGFREYDVLRAGWAFPIGVAPVAG